MKKIINGKMYNTETACLMGSAVIATARVTLDVAVSSCIRSGQKSFLCMEVVAR